MPRKVLTLFLAIIMILLCFIIYLEYANISAECQEIDIVDVRNVDLSHALTERPQVGIGLNDFLFIKTVARRLPFYHRWIELGTGQGFLTSMLENIIDVHPLGGSIKLLSIDGTDRKSGLHGNYSITFPTTEFVVANSKDLKSLLFGKRMIIFNPESNFTSPEEFMQFYEVLLDEFSLILAHRDHLPSKPLFFRIHEEFLDLAKELGSDFVVLEKTETFNSDEIEFNWDLFPKGVSKQLVNLPDSTFRIYDWLIFSRIQKCGTKTLRTIVHQSLIRELGGCYRDFLVSLPANKIQCTLFPPCAHMISEMKAMNTRNCRVALEQHCDWRDLFTPWDPVDESTKIMTWLRDPVRRTVSEWKHVYNTHAKTWDYCLHSDGDEFTKANFLSFISNPNHEYGMWNRQTRMLAGCGSKYRCEEIYESPEIMLNVAKYHLLLSTIVGTMELFTESIFLLNHALQWNVTHYLIEQEGRDKMVLDWTIDEEVTEQVLKYNSLDKELHDFATELINLRVKQFKQKMNLVDLPVFNCSENDCQLSYVIPFADKPSLHNIS